MRSKVESYMKENGLIEHGDTVVVGVSGGADSMALLALLVDIQKDFALKVVAAHLNHQLRPGDCDRDEALVENYCRKNRIPFENKRVNIKERANESNQSVELTGRAQRYDFYEEVCRKWKGSKIATAHHEDDQIETIMMRIIKGTGVKGLMGISNKRDRRIIRPLLACRKSEIVDYCEKNEIPYREDHTNYETEFLRNKIRLNIIPEIEKINPSFGEELLHLSEIAGEYEAFVQEQVQGVLQEIKGKEKIAFESLRKEKPIVRKMVLLSKLQESYGNLLISYSVFAKINQLLEQEGNTTWSLDIGEGIVLQRVYDFVKWSKREEKVRTKYFEYEWIEGKEQVFPRIGWFIRTDVEENTKTIKSFAKSNEKYLDYDKIIRIEEKMIIRQRKPGDRIQLVGRKSHKKAKDYFIDRKIPKEDRDRTPVFIVGETIAFIPHIGVSEKFKVDQNTKRILKIRYKDCRRV
ncbi:MAG TPA: tRNA lysidine(34) synthetase TilS [Eubacteriaceae bacterium]|nr:tRNA lysidine(34) synthetase TilS [Eubacteriaceae bacterium]